ncbi:MAG: penicillin-binding transpeptidase domain-containing protein [Thermomicrobiales bacterium]
MTAAQAAIVIEPATGAVLAIASSPAVDPVPLAAVTQAQVNPARAAWQQLLDDPARPLVRRATEGLYPPGSTFKVVTRRLASVRVRSRQTRCSRTTGSIKIKTSHPIEEANRPDETIDLWTLADGFRCSLNIVFAQVGLQIGRTILEEQAAAFRIGEPIPFDEPVSRGQIARATVFSFPAPAVWFRVRSGRSCW